MKKQEFVGMIERCMPEDADAQAWSIQYEAENGNAIIGIQGSAVDAIVFVGGTLNKMAEMLLSTPAELAKVALAMNEFQASCRDEEEDEDE